VRLDRDGRLSEQSLADMLRWMQRIAAAINGELSLGDGTESGWTGNLDGQLLRFVTPSVAGTVLEVPHSLARKPVGYLVVRKSGTGVLRDAQPESWRDDVIKLASSGGLESFWIVVF
jgi:hypothetical protein